MEDNKSLIFFSLILLFTISGCATSGPLSRPNQSFRQEYLNSHPELSPQIRQAILEGKVIKGMTKENVMASWGEPTKINYVTQDKSSFWYTEDFDEEWTSGESDDMSKKHPAKKKRLIDEEDLEEDLEYADEDDEDEIIVAVSDNETGEYEHWLKTNARHRAHRRQPRPPRPPKIVKPMPPLPPLPPLPDFSFSSSVQ